MLQTIKKLCDIDYIFNYLKILGATLEVEINVKPDRSYDIAISSPIISYLLMMAAGIRRPAQDADKG